ncbi:MAG: heavy-metal-associated domain-containing protein [Ilumatobacteraceae bacterium]
MRTTLNAEGANCSFCFNAAIEDLGRIDGVRAVYGSIAESCIEIDHDDVALDVLTSSVRVHLHGVAMFSNEIRMVPLDPVVASTPCIHRRDAPPTVDTSPGRSDVSHIHPAMTLGDIVMRHPSR